LGRAWTIAAHFTRVIGESAHVYRVHRTQHQFLMIIIDSDRYLPSKKWARMRDLVLVESTEAGA